MNSFVKLKGLVLQKRLKLKPAILKDKKIEVIDHIIVTKNDFFSFKEKNLIN